MSDLFSTNHLDKLNIDNWQPLIKHLAFVGIRFLGKGAYYAVFSTEFKLFFSIEEGGKKDTFVVRKLNSDLKVEIIILDDVNRLAGNIYRAISDIEWVT